MTIWSGPVTVKANERVIVKVNQNGATTTKPWPRSVETDLALAALQGRHVYHHGGGRAGEGRVLCQSHQHQVRPVQPAQLVLDRCG